MKIKEALEKLNHLNLTTEYNTRNRDILLDIFLQEFTVRQKLRFSERDISLNAMMSLTKEMSDWTKKLMIEYGFNITDANEFSKTLYDTTGQIANKYKVIHSR